MKFTRRKLLALAGLGSIPVAKGIEAKELKPGATYLILADPRYVSDCDIERLYDGLSGLGIKGSVHCAHPDSLQIYELKPEE